MIVTYGSLNVDMVMTVDALPRPGETVLCPGYVLVPGGKGANQACAAARASGAGRVAMVGTVGPDDWGPLATHLLREAGVDVTHIARGTKPTACAAIWVEESGENAIVVASGANLETSADQIPDTLLNADTLLLLQMEVPEAGTWEVIARAHANGAKILLNVAPARPVPDEVLHRVDILVLNEIEAAMLTKGPDAGPVDAAEAGAAARQLADKYDLTCIVTLGAAGAVAHAPGEAWSVEALPITPVDTTGAGDAFVGTLAAAIDGGDSLPEALRRAAVGSGLACLRVGCQSAYAQAHEIAARLPEVPLARPVETLA